MGQILHGSATTTHAVRAAIQRSKAPLKELAAQYGLNHKTVAKWRKRAFVNDVPMGPKAPRSTVLSPGEEAIVVAFRKHTPPLFMDKRPSMTDADQMRDRAARLSALAGQAREHRAPGYARELEQIAAGILAHAQAIDRREGTIGRLSLAASDALA
jgi:hypothetical protein